jgi:hypothetical protein
MVFVPRTHNSILTVAICQEEKIEEYSIKDVNTTLQNCQDHENQRKSIKLSEIGGD